MDGSAIWGEGRLVVAVGIVPTLPDHIQHLPRDELTAARLRPNGLAPVDTTPVGHSEAQLIQEGLVSIAEVAKKLPRVRGKRVCNSTVIRWILHGKCVNREHVCLEGCRLGGPGWWTSWAAVGRFSAALSQVRNRKRQLIAFMAGVGAYVRLAVEVAHGS